MAEGSSGSMGMVGVIAGVLIIVVIGFFLVEGSVFGTKSVHVNVKPPAATTPAAPAAPASK